MSAATVAGPRLVWRPDLNLWNSHEFYRDAVGWLVDRFLPGVSPSTLRVLEADDGDLALVAESFVDEFGEFFRDPDGRVIQRTRWAPLPDGVVLP